MAKILPEYGLHLDRLVVNVDTISGKATAGSIAVTGEGDSTTTNLQQGLLKAWAYLTGGGTPSLDDNFNVSSVDDVGVGDRRLNFANNMANATYFMGAGIISDGNSGGTRGAAGHHLASVSTSQLNYRILYGSTSSSDGNLSDGAAVDSVGVAGDLA
jgi:hypothetical protein